MNQLENKVNAKRKLIQKHQLELRELLETCTHTGTVVEKSHYFSGSYYDKAHTTLWNECTLCGAKSEEIVKEHSYYG
jgi:hypothetical protein